MDGYQAFQFVTTTRTTSNTFRRRRDEVGIFKTRLQIEQLLGGSNNKEAVAQAANYVDMCLRPDLKTSRASTSVRGLSSRVLHP